MSGTLPLARRASTVKVVIMLGQAHTPEVTNRSGVPLKQAGALSIEVLLSRRVGVREGVHSLSVHQGLQQVFRLATVVSLS